MSEKNNELSGIIKEFAEMEWDVLESPAREWLKAGDDSAKKAAAPALIAAVEQADKECGSCGCDFDQKYKRALELLRAA